MGKPSYKKLFCFGYGYTADYLGQALITQGNWTLEGTTRDTMRQTELKTRGIKTHLFDAKRPLSDPNYILKGVTHLLLSAPPDTEGDPVFVAHAREIAALPSLEWIGYLSSTGVYGDREGGWVDEASEIRPSTIRGTRRALAERQWLCLNELPLHIFRLAGIYGPQRSALDSVRAGISRRIDKPGHAFSRVHIEDIIQVLLASMTKPHAGQAYNVADDLPAPSHEVIAYACTLLGLSIPPLIPFAAADLVPITRSFYAENKRIRNTRIKEELGVSLLYPTYREGLAACLAMDQAAHKLLFTGMH